MRAILSSDYFYPRIGGITTRIEYLARSLEERGHEVVVLTKKANFDDSSLGLNVIRIESLFESESVLDLPKMAEIESIIARLKPDVVHAHHAFSPASLFSMSVAKKRGVATVLTNHSIQFMYNFDLLWRPSSYVLFPIRQMIDNADRIIAVSRAARDFIRYFTDKDVAVIPNGVCVKEFAPEKREFDERSILFVGRLVYRKGIHLLLDMMLHVVEELPDAHLAIAGTGYLAPLIKPLVKARGLQKNVTLVLEPSRRRLIELYRRANVFVLPSIFGESFGIVVLEAMASKTPVVAANQGGVSEIVEHGETGFLVRRGDVKAMASYVTRLLEDKSCARAIAERAFARAWSYDWSVITPRIERIYQEAINEAPGSRAKSANTM